MDETNLGPLPPFNTIGIAEKTAFSKTMNAPLSGYLGGINKGGYWVEKLQADWCETFKVKHAVACNSATSGLLAACIAINIGPGDVVWVSSYTMSATAACAKVLGANIVFMDIETTRYSLYLYGESHPKPKCIIVTNLFGHPAHLRHIKSWCDENSIIMIEDNAQSPFAMEGFKYTGTIGHIGVFSLNVHKHIQCGEGGVIVTNDDEIYDNIQRAVNHGELAPRKFGYDTIGLNLRMTEPIAAIAVAQLAKGYTITESRRELASDLSSWFSDVPWMLTPVEDDGCRHVYYAWAARVLSGNRRKLLNRLNKAGFPMCEGYSRPLHRIFKDMHGDRKLPVVEQVEDKELITFEVCRWNPGKKQRRKMEEIVKRAVGEIDDNR